MISCPISRRANVPPKPSSAFVGCGRVFEPHQRIKKSWRSWQTSVFIGVFAGSKLANFTNAMISCPISRRAKIPPKPSSAFVGCGRVFKPHHRIEESWRSWPSSLFTGIFAGLKLANFANEGIKNEAFTPTLPDGSDGILPVCEYLPFVAFVNFRSKSSFPFGFRRPRKKSWYQSSREFEPLRPYLIFHRVFQATFHFPVVKKFARLHPSSRDFT